MLLLRSLSLRLGVLFVSAFLFACASREAAGIRSVTILGEGVVNDPKNKSLRFDLLKFGLERFCDEMSARGLALKMTDDEPVMGRFYSNACNTQVIDDDARKSFVVQYAGTGFAANREGGRVGFSTTGLAEYAPDFMLHNGMLYVYFRPRVVDATRFETLLVESALAQTALKLLGVDADAFGRKVVDAQIRRGFTVVRYGSSGETEFATGILPLGERPYRPFSVESEGKRVVTNERTEVHVGQQDFMGPLSVDADNRALYLTMKVDGAPAVDALLVPEAVGRSMLDSYTKRPGAAAATGTLLNEPAMRGPIWKRFVTVPRGKYFLVIDNSAVSGHTSPPAGPSDGTSARVDILILEGDRP